MKNIAVLTSGGDSPGMNAAIRAVVRTAIFNGAGVLGVREGYKGLIENSVINLGVYSVADIIHRGGTFLQTARIEEMKTPEGLKKAAETLQKHNVGGLVVIGGDGSYRGALELSKYGVNVAAVPATIDNDIPCTDYSIGFDTAVNTALEAISRIRDTSSSNNRVDIIEVMGRNCGNIALLSGLAGGAEAIVVPEVPYSIEEICEKMLKGKKRGKLHSIMVFAEGSGDVREFCRQVEHVSGVDCRATILGYIQRGGAPSAFDRIIASRMGAAATETLLAGRRNKAICMRENKYIDMDLNDALAVQYHFDEEAYRVAMQLSI